MTYNLPVPSDKVAQAGDVKWMDAQRRLSYAVTSVGSRNTSRGFPKAVSWNGTKDYTQIPSYSWSVHMENTYGTADSSVFKATSPRPLSLTNKMQ